MKFTAMIAHQYLDALGDEREDKLLEIIQQTLWNATLPQNQEENIAIEFSDMDSDIGTFFDITMDSGIRDLETVKDIIYEAFLLAFDPKFNSDILVSINTEL